MILFLVFNIAVISIVTLQCSPSLYLNIDKAFKTFILKLS